MTSSLRTEAAIRAERAELERRLADLDDEEQKLASFPPEVLLADALHTLQCRQNHTDGCGWEYGTWDGDPIGWRDERRRYVSKAHTIREKLKAYFTDEQILEVVSAIVR